MNTLVTIVTTRSATKDQQQRRRLDRPDRVDLELLRHNDAPLPVVAIRQPRRVHEVLTRRLVTYTVRHPDGSPITTADGNVYGMAGVTLPGRSCVQLLIREPADDASD